MDILKFIIVITSFLGIVFLSTNMLKRLPRIEFLFYFTNLSNIFILIYHLFNINNKYLLFSITLYLFVTFLIFNFLLLPYGRKNNLSIKDINLGKTENLLVHNIVPLLSMFYWFKFGVNIKYSESYLVLLFPIAYVMFCFIYGKSGRPLDTNPTNYIYPFFDLDKLGIKKVGLIVSTLILLLLVISTIMIFVKNCI